MNEALFHGMVIGIAVGGFILAAISGRDDSFPVHKAKAVASFSIGAAIAWWFYKNLDEIEPIIQKIVSSGLGVVFAALGAAVLFWKIRWWLK